MSVHPGVERSQADAEQDGRLGLVALGLLQRVQIVMLCKFLEGVRSLWSRLKSGTAGCWLQAFCLESVRETDMDAEVRAVVVRNGILNEPNLQHRARGQFSL